MKSVKLRRRNRIKRGIRSRLRGTTERPRLTVYRSNKEIYGQLVDDLKGHTMLAFSSKSKEMDEGTAGVERAHKVGKLLAEKAVEAGLNDVVFDRNGFLYHGRVKAFAEGAREGGLKF